jgi:hypothetical protein
MLTERAGSLFDHDPVVIALALGDEVPPRCSEHCRGRS